MVTLYTCGGYFVHPALVHDELACDCAPSHVMSIQNAARAHAMLGNTLSSPWMSEVATTTGSDGRCDAGVGGSATLRRTALL